MTLWCRNSLHQKGNKEREVRYRHILQYFHTRYRIEPPRGKNILEQLSKPRFFTEFENRALFFPSA